MHSARKTRAKAAREVAGSLDHPLFKALCEPARVEIVRLLTLCGRCDLKALAARLPQDASVVSRHLSVLHDAGVVRREKLGRHVYFEIDGPTVCNRMEKILARFRSMAAICCPGEAEETT